MNALALTISDISIRQDDNGRYCLNDLHKAAGGEKRHQPSDWLRIQQTQELIAELEIYEPGITGTKMQAIETIQGKGKQQGTYAVKELVYAYAMWISAKFHIAVIRAYDALVTTPQYALKPLPLKKTKIAVEGGLSLETQDEIKALIKELAQGLPKDRQASATVSMWRALNTHFETKGLKGGSKLAGYKFIPEASRLECLSLLARLPFNELLTLTRVELDGIVAERLMAFPKPAPLEGGIMPKPQHNSITYHFAPLENNAPRRLLLVQTNDIGVSLMPIDDDKEVMSKEQFIRELQHDNQFICFNKDEVSIRKLVNEYIPAQHLPSLIESAAQRLQAINKKVA